MKNNLNTYNDLRARLETPRVDDRPAVYIDYPRDVTDDDIRTSVKRCAKCGIGLIIPTFDVGGFDYIHPMRFLQLYGVLLECASENNVRVALNLTHDIEEGMVDYLDDECDDGGESVRQRVLLKREYFCTNEEDVNIQIRENIVSITAIEEHGEFMDLRGSLKNGILSCKMPLGNWKIIRYFCAEDTEHKAVNIMNYAASTKYLETLMTLFRDNFSEHIGKTMPVITFSNIGFSAPNRRNWDESFGEIFKATYSFDPAPYYPCLYDVEETKHKHFKALLMANRAKMLENGFMRAVRDVAMKYGMIAVGSLLEPKISASSWTVGDAMLCQRNTPCMVLEKAYLYGMNSAIVASGAADMSDAECRVHCELFRDYNRVTRDAAHRETMTAFSRGAENIMIHMPRKKAFEDGFITDENMTEYSKYISGLTTLLGGGERISDIMLLYPIYSLHSKTCLYEAETDERFEYPDTPDSTDYMTLINSVSAYTGQSISLVHPDLFSSFDVDDGKITPNGKHPARVLVLPTCEMISIEDLRKISAFFDGGGKVVATGALPRLSFELDENGGNYDNEVEKLVLHVFGTDAAFGTLYSDYTYNKNDRGGEAYFIYSTKTGSDRTCLVSSEKILDAIMAFNIPYDVYISNMPRLECTGALNNNYPEYKMLGLDTSIKGGGMFGHLHKKKDGYDIYFFSNATDVDYSGDVYLLGRHDPVALDVITGEITEISYRYAEQWGEEYTCVRLELAHGKSTVIISKSDM